MPAIYQEHSYISSAEMTAYWRCAYKISGDDLSSLLTTHAGVKLANDFQTRFNYLLVARKVSVRARFFLETACSLIESSQYDSCISLGSGFSLLSHFIRLQTNKNTLRIIDTDLEEVLNEKSNRINKIEDENLISELNKIQTQVLDLESAAKYNLSLKNIFPNAKSPIFIIEGVIYFLTADCVRWLFKEISDYECSAVILDYWPEDGVQQSACFDVAVNNLKGFMKESVISYFEPSFWDQSNFKDLTKKFERSADISIKDYDEKISAKSYESHMLINQDEFFPVRLYVGECFSI